MHNINIGRHTLGFDQPLYFVADIAATDDGNLACAKYQHFKAGKIVSDVGFGYLEHSKMSYQASWQKHF